ncbi:MAG: flagellar basal-body rod protein FlgF [Acidobacteriota bacterium]|nr:flagellar basal-body rod protein FlgF [Acidobacteriota bacterium]
MAISDGDDLFEIRKEGKLNSGIYTAYSGLKAHSDALEITANNLANINTTGFKADKSFNVFLRESVNDSGYPAEIGRTVNMAVRADRRIDYSDGTILSTGRNLDVAIRGDGFLTVQTPRGERYTRNGNMHLDANSTLRTADGNPVLGVSGRPITLGPGEINISDNGNVYLDGEEVDRLRVVVFQNNSQVEKEGESLFFSRDGATPTLRTDMVVRSGYLEQANVNAVKAMVDMIGIMRQFESIQRSVTHEMNDMNAKVIDRLGRA